MELINRYKTYKKCLHRTRESLINLKDYALDELKKNVVRGCCPICESEEYSFGFHAPIYTFMKCDKCNFFYARLLYDDDILNNFYIDNKYNQERVQIEYDIILEQIKRGKLGVHNIIKKCMQFQPGKDKCLDIGCGIGANLSFLKPHFKSAEGIEMNKWAAQKARELFGLTVYTEDLKELGLKENSYDLIILNMVIEHISDLDVFEHIYKLLKPNGILGIACPTTDSISFRLFKGDWVHVREFLHVNAFNNDSFKVFAKRFNFKIEYIKSDDTLDIQINDLICKHRKNFMHKYNDVPFINPINLGATILTNKILDKTRLLSRFNLGDYIEVVMRKEIK